MYRQIQRLALHTISVNYHQSVSTHLFGMSHTLGGTLCRHNEVVSGVSYEVLGEGNEWSLGPEWRWCPCQSDQYIIKDLCHSQWCR